MYTTLTTITWYSVITTLTMYSMVLCRLQVNKSYNNNEYTSVAADPALVSLKDCADIAIDTRLQWANKIIEVFQSSTESHTTLRPWDFLLSLDGSVELGTVPNSDADHHKAYPPRFCIPPDTLLGFNQEDQIKRAEFFALGSLIFEIMSGKVPFEDLSDDEVQLAYSRGEFPDDVKSLPLWRSILGCWSLDSGKESEEFSRSCCPLFMNLQL